MTEFEIAADRYDIQRLAYTYENLMHMFRTGDMTQFGYQTGARVVLNEYIRLSQKLGVKLVNDHVLERLDAMIIDSDERRAQVATKIFNAKNKENV